MSKLVLIGTDHLDPEGPTRLEEVLHTIQPNAVTVEATPRFNTLNKRWGELWARYEAQLGGNVGWITDLRGLFSNYEWNVTEKYAMQNNIDCTPVDHDSLWGAIKLSALDVILRWSMDKLVKKQRKNNIDPRILEAFCGKYNPNVIYAITDMFADEGGHKVTFSGRDRFKTAERDEYMAQRIREETSRVEGTLVHVGGAFHLFDEPGRKSLYGMLRDLNPVRRTLYRPLISGDSNQDGCSTCSS